MSTVRLGVLNFKGRWHSQNAFVLSRINSCNLLGMIEIKLTAKVRFMWQICSC